MLSKCCHANPAAEMDGIPAVHDCCRTAQNFPFRARAFIAISHLGRSFQEIFRRYANGLWQEENSNRSRYRACDERQQ